MVFEIYIDFHRRNFENALYPGVEKMMETKQCFQSHLPSQLVCKIHKIEIGLRAVQSSHHHTAADSVNSQIPLALEFVTCAAPAGRSMCYHVPKCAIVCCKYLQHFNCILVLATFCEYIGG